MIFSSCASKNSTLPSYLCFENNHTERCQSVVPKCSDSKFQLITGNVLSFVGKTIGSIGFIAFLGASATPEYTNNYDSEEEKLLVGGLAVAFAGYGIAQVGENLIEGTCE